MWGSTVIPAVVIGAGPYGLSVAAHLRELGISTRVFGEPMSSWAAHMPAGMFLKSAWYASSISSPKEGYSLADYCLEHGVPPLTDRQPVPLDLFVQYGLWFQNWLVPDVERARVRRLARANGHLEVALDTGEELRAARVIVATGLEAFPNIPAELAALAPAGPSPTGPVSHSSQHHDLSRYIGREVVVVGGGQSALETAALLHEAGAQACIVARTPVAFSTAPKFDADGREKFTLYKPRSPLGGGWPLLALTALPDAFRQLPASVRLDVVRRVLGPAGAWWLRDRVLGRLPLHEAHRITKAHLVDGRIILKTIGTRGATRTFAADHVIAATGFRVDLAALDFLDEATRNAIARTGAYPRLSASFESSVPGLFFVGQTAAATFGSLLRFVCGSTFAARRISTAVTADPTRA